MNRTRVPLLHYVLFFFSNSSGIFFAFCFYVCRIHLTLVTRRVSIIPSSYSICKSISGGSGKGIAAGASRTGDESMFSPLFVEVKIKKIKKCAVSWKMQNNNGYVVSQRTDMSHNLIISKSRDVFDFDFDFVERIPRVWHKLTPRGQIEFHVHEFPRYT